MPISFAKDSPGIIINRSPFHSQKCPILDNNPYGPTGRGTHNLEPKAVSARSRGGICRAVELENVGSGTSLVVQW